MVKVIWGKAALDQLKSHCEYVAEDSPKAAEKIKKGIFEITDKLAQHPEIYPPDRFRKNNKGDFRAFDKYNLRVSYQVTAKQIRIVRVRHTSRSPLKY
jgi:plasmid stabilization system protein ParE